MAAKAVAGAWNVPLLRLDFGRLYNKYVGETESNIRQALKTANIMAPCILWIDELEKGVAVNDIDDGTSQRILATLLTWMVESNNQVFIVATLNAIDQFPPELIRKGRLDEVFFFDLPDTNVRNDIFRIHTNKCALDLTRIDFEKLALITEGFSSSEIEQIVVSAIYAAHTIDVLVNTRSMIEEIQVFKTLSIVMAEKIAALRHWAKDRTVSVD
ncbi:MAG: SpoVK/Ycf46/Vps4 family AAA+-type ATPase [Gammaproteobacteria bacterium]|jgi:SpoVK/Ycf46/Vps4 family AAA+-type ATPase